MGIETNIVDFAGLMRREFLGHARLKKNMFLMAD